MPFTLPLRPARSARGVPLGAPAVAGPLRGGGRLPRLAAATLLVLAGPWHALAEDAPPPGSPAHGTARARAHAKTAAKPPEKSAPKAPEPWQAVDPARVARPAGSPGTMQATQGGGSLARPVDPVELGGKWSAANDSAERTRVQNYNGDAVGTGGELGLKLHF